MSIRTKRNCVRLAGAVFASTMLTLGCANAQKPEPVRIGVPTALTGPYGGLAEQVVRAVKFAVDQANKAGGVDGRQVEYRVYDTEYSPDGARRQAEKLSLEGFNLLTGTISSGESLIMAPLLKRWDAIYVATIPKANKISGEACTPRLFRVNKMDGQDQMVVQSWLGGRKEAKWGIIAADIAFGHDGANSFTATAKAKGKEVVATVFASPNTTDYAPYIQQLRSSGAEAVWIVLGGRPAIDFITQATQFGLFPSVFGGGINLVADDAIKALGNAARGMQGTINYTSTLDTPKNKAFVAAWKAYYNGDEPTNYEGETYLGVQIILEAVHQAGSVKPIDVVGKLNGGTFQTILGDVTMRAEDHQLVAPNYFGHAGESDGKLKPIIDKTFGGADITPPPSPDCKMGELK